MSAAMAKNPPRFLRLNFGCALEEDWWRSSPRAFGGQLAAHLLMAAAEVAPQGWCCHSLHVHFVAAGRMVPTRYETETLRLGRSFTLLAVRALELATSGNPRLIAAAAVSFHAASEERGAVELHAAPMPHAPAPASTAAGCCKAWNDSHEGGGLSCWQMVPADQTGLRWWMSWRGGDVPQPLPSLLVGGDSARTTHAAALAFLSDLQFLLSAGSHHADGRMGTVTPTMTTSLDHVLYLHAWPVDASAWLLFEYDSPHAGGGRATVRARVWAEDGRLVASAVQEGVYRVAVSQPESTERLLPPEARL